MASFAVRTADREGDADASGAARGNRTKVLVSRLRAAGLGSLPQTAREGARLDPKVTFFVI